MKMIRNIALLVLAVMATSCKPMVFDLPSEEELQTLETNMGGIGGSMSATLIYKINLGKLKETNDLFKQYSTIKDPALLAQVINNLNSIKSQMGMVSDLTAKMIENEKASGPYTDKQKQAVNKLDSLAKTAVQQAENMQKKVNSLQQ